jgi:hypothetical protein
MRGFKYLLRRNPIHVAEVETDLHCLSHEPVLNMGLLTRMLVLFNRI